MSTTRSLTALMSCAALLLASCPQGELALEPSPDAPSETSLDGADPDTAADEDGGEVVAGPVDAPSELGAFVVGHMQLSETDAARGDRQLVVDVWYPVDPSDVAANPEAAPTSYLLGGVFNFPSDHAFDGLPVSARSGQTLLLFSHGYRSINTQSVTLVETLASHGFIVVSPEHTGNSQGSPEDDFETAAAHRVPDITFVIDRFIERHQSPSDPFFGRLDTTAFGGVGHSFGGMTALGVACGWAGAAADPRVTAIAPISAVIQADLQSSQRTSPFAGFSQEQLGSITIPTLLLGGTEDIAVPVANNALAFSWMTSAPRVYQVDIIGANHTHFANVCDIGDLLISAGITQDQWAALGAGDLIEPYDRTCTPEAFPIQEATRLQNLYVVSFFKTHLLDEAAYEAFLTVAYADTEAAVSFTRK